MTTLQRDPASPPGPARGRRRRIALVVVAVLALGFLWTPWGTGHRLNGQTLLVEWTRCVVGGSPPSAQPALHRAYRLHARARAGPPAYRAPADALPVVEPRQALAHTGEPLPDHPSNAVRTVTVAVIDSGVQADHPDLATTAVRPGLDLLNPCGNGRQDVTGHGTMVAGVLASRSHGAASGVSILPVRVSLGTGQNPRWLSAAGIVWATNQGADIINMSFSSQRGRPSIPERLAIGYARRRGVALVAAAGNDPTRPAGYPAAYPSVLSVTSIDGRGDLSVFAARTGNIDVAAPGSRVLTLSTNGSFRDASGTSFAAPVVSAAIAQLLTAHPELSGAEAAAALQGASEPAPDWTELTAAFGVLDLRAALTQLCEAAPWCSPPPPRVPSPHDSWAGVVGPPAQATDGWALHLGRHEHDPTSPLGRD